MDKEKLKEKVLNLVKEKNYVTFVEIENLLKDDMVVEGEVTLYLNDNPNLFFWVNISQEFSDTITSLVKEKKIFMHPSSLLTYLIDGKHLNLPIVKRNVKYKKPHWLPLYFSTDEFTAKVK